MKLEGGRAVADAVKQMTSRWHSVMGHLGLLPLAIHQLGRLQKTSDKRGSRGSPLAGCAGAAGAGAFAIVLECVPSAAAQRVTVNSRFHIGIGAGPGCDARSGHQRHHGLSNPAPRSPSILRRRKRRLTSAAKMFALRCEEGRFHPGRGRKLPRQFNQPDRGVAACALLARA